MIRSIRRKFILIVMASLLGTMAVLCAAIGAGNRRATTNRVDKAIFILHQNGGTFLPPAPAWTPRISISRSRRRPPLRPDTSSWS